MDRSADRGAGLAAGPRTTSRPPRGGPRGGARDPCRGPSRPSTRPGLTPQGSSRPSTEARWPGNSSGEGSPRIDPRPARARPVDTDLQEENGGLASALSSGQETVRVFTRAGVDRCHAAAGVHAWPDRMDPVGPAEVLERKGCASARMRSRGVGVSVELVSTWNDAMRSGARAGWGSARPRRCRSAPRSPWYGPRGAMQTARATQ